MTLVPGTRLGVYEVVAPLGAGGMGEVYRARDTKLGRDVAIKVLAESFVADPERVARFRREAQILAALNHPHIASIYGLEEAAGGQFLVMELVEGGTLAERVAAPGPWDAPRSEGEQARGGPAGLPLDEALGIARQIAEALQAAHEKGIVHRDLKPANIAISAEGQVKVLDFGLAKVNDPNGPNDPNDFTSSPTLTVAATQAGVILGTAAYMSPEQARGKPADRRSDIWAFGCVLYEMLSGKRAFQGEDISETLAFVLTKDPDWTSLPASVPASVRALLMRCMERDRQRRVADISTVLFVLDEASGTDAASNEPGQVPRRGLAGSRDQNTAHARSLLRRALPVIVAALVAAVLTGGAVWSVVRPAPSRVVRSEIATSGATRLRFSGVDRNLAIAPDGSRVVYRDNNQVLMRALDQLEPVVIVSLGAPRGVFVSSDSQWVGFFDEFSLRKVAMAGGPVVPIGRVDGTGRGATWGPDGTIVYATTAIDTGLQRVPAAGGDRTVLTKPDRERGEGDHLWPEFLPGGQVVLFTITAALGGLDGAQIAALDLSTGTSKVIMRGGHHAQYLPTGHLLYGAGGSLRAVGFDRDRLEVLGTPVPVVEQVATTPQGGVDAAVAADGTLVYVPWRGLAGGRSLVWVDRMGREESVPAPQRAYQYPRISPDGTRLALDVRDQEFDIWIWDFARLTFTRLTFEQGAEEYPVWMPDSRRVVFGAGPTQAQNLFWRSADGIGLVQRLTESPSDQDAQGVTPDGRLLIFRETKRQEGSPSDLMLLPLVPSGSLSVGLNESGTEGSPQARPLIRTRFSEENAEISSDGEWLAYESNESGRREIYVRPFPNIDGGRWQVSTLGGRTPLWSRDGQELFYLTPEAKLMGVRVEKGPVWRSSTPTQVLQGQYYYGAPGTGRTFDIAPDGRRFLMIRQAGVDEAAPQNIVVAQNWTQELKRLVPVP